ncbi:MAG: galactose oxidase-like domain-containing protein, partial [Candidatus Binatia bacterium]
MIQDRIQFFLLSLITILWTVLPVTAVAAQTDPAIVGRWSFAPNLPFYPVHVNALPTGGVMLWSDDSGDPRLWSRATQSTTLLAHPGFDVYCSGHSLLPDGRLLVAGGHIQNNIGLPNASIYDPYTNAWTSLPDMNAGRWYPTNTTLANGDVLVVSGSIDLTTGINPLPQIYDLETGAWRDLTNATLSLDLYPRMHVAPNGSVFNSSPSTITRYLDTSGSGAWTAVANQSYYRDSGSSVMYNDGKILIAGGGDPPTNTAEVIDLNSVSPAWRSVAPMAVPRRHQNATILPNGRVLVTGGTRGPGFNNTTTPVYAAEMWNPATEQWTTMASARIPRLYHSAALLLPDGRVLSTGGNDYLEAEIYEPPYLFKGSRPTISSAPQSVTYGETFVVGTLNAPEIKQVTWIRLSSVTHAFNMDQRFSRLSFSRKTGGLRVVAPASSYVAPPGYYMLFILNDQGVPSVAKNIRIGPAVSPPDTTITAAPGNPSNSSTASFSFLSSKPGSSFQCKLDEGKFVACASPRDDAGLSQGSHTFQVRAVDTFGNVDPTPATYTWTYTPVIDHPDDTVINVMSLAGGTAASLSSDDNSYHKVNSTVSGTRTTSWQGIFNAVP